MSPIPLVLVGASVRALAWSAHRLGWSCTAIDLFADRDTARFATTLPVRRMELDDIQAIWPACDRPAILYTGGIENHPEILDWLATQGTLWGNGADAVRTVRDLGQLARIAHSAGLRVPEIRIPSSTMPFPEDHSTAGWLWKPYRSAGGGGIRRLSGMSTSMTTTSNTGGYWQRETRGIPCSAQILADPYTTHVIGFARQWIAEDWTDGGGFQFAGGIFPFAVPANIQASVRKFAEHYQTLGLRGWFGIDFLLDGETAWILEVNPRPTAMGELIEQSRGMSIVDCQRRVFEGQRLASLVQAAPSPDSTECWGKAIVYADRACIAREFPLDDPGLADLPGPGTQFPMGQPICTVLARGSDPETLQATLAERMRMVRETLVFTDPAALPPSPAR